MKSFHIDELLGDLTSITERNLQFIGRQLRGLSSAQMNWKKDNKTWSVNEILAHLNAYASYYNKTLALRISGTRHREKSEKFVSSPLGRSAWSSMKLGNAQNIKRTIRSPKMYNPSVNPTLLSGNELDTFEQGQLELLDIIKEASKVNLKKVKIPISISKIIRLRLGDALMFVVYHNERHVQQIKNVLMLPNFIKNPS
jgi:hypothetical protein